ncbi:hypothetical protein GGX14DRAFT_660541 [Mycena pura]|uniref:Uncharacterized protein n=1 Tax=Mycena pura TaxID=153505 RepID=A0AAD6Y907_9AGAR|nr:hypothetical protein GGX14DRAFT_660541 [Mycena pura]
MGTQHAVIPAAQLGGSLAAVCQSAVRRGGDYAPSRYWVSDLLALYRYRCHSISGALASDLMALLQGQRVMRARPWTAAVRFGGCKRLVQYATVDGPPFDAGWVCIASATVQRRGGHEGAARRSESRAYAEVLCIVVNPHIAWTFRVQVATARASVLSCAHSRRQSTGNPMALARHLRSRLQKLRDRRRAPFDSGVGTRVEGVYPGQFLSCESSGYYRYRYHFIICPRGTDIRPNGAGAPAVLSAASKANALRVRDHGRPPFDSAVRCGVRGAARGLRSSFDLRTLRASGYLQVMPMCAPIATSFCAARTLGYPAYWRCTDAEVTSSYALGALASDLMALLSRDSPEMDGAATVHCSESRARGSFYAHCSAMRVQRRGAGLRFDLRTIVGIRLSSSYANVRADCHSILGSTHPRVSGLLALPGSARGAEVFHPMHRASTLRFECQNTYLVPIPMSSSYADVRADCHSILRSTHPRVSDLMAQHDLMALARRRCSQQGQRALAVRDRGRLLFDSAAPRWMARPPSTAASRAHGSFHAHCSATCADVRAECHSILRSTHPRVSGLMALPGSARAEVFHPMHRASTLRFECQNTYLVPILTDVTRILCPRGTGIRPNGAGAPAVLSAARPARVLEKNNRSFFCPHWPAKPDGAEVHGAATVHCRVARGTFHAHAHCSAVQVSAAAGAGPRFDLRTILGMQPMANSTPIAPPRGGQRSRRGSESRARADVLCTVVSRPPIQSTYRVRNPSSSCNGAGLPVRLKLRALPGIQPNGAGASPAVSVAKRLRDRGRAPFDSGGGCGPAVKRCAVLFLQAQLGYLLGSDG